MIDPCCNTQFDICCSIRFDILDCSEKNMHNVEIMHMTEEWLKTETPKVLHRFMSVKKDFGSSITPKSTLIIRIDRAANSHTKDIIGEVTFSDDSLRMSSNTSADPIVIQYSDPNMFSDLQLAIMRMFNSSPLDNMDWWYLNKR